MNPIRWTLRKLLDADRCARLVGNLDFPVQEDVLRRVVRGIRNDYRSLLYHEHVAASVIANLLRFRQSIEAAELLEIGPGAHHVVAVMCILHGARRYRSIDFYPMSTGPDPCYMRMLREDLATGIPLLQQVGGLDRNTALERFDGCFSDASLSQFAPERIQIQIAVEASKLPFDDGEFDAVFSNAVLEHVFDPPAAIGEIRRVLRPGGFSIHQVDFRDHTCAEDPWDFLRYDDSEWKAKGHVSPAYTNRMRVSRMREAFVAQGLSPIEVETNMSGIPSAETIERWHECFQGLSREDIETLSALFVSRKRAHD